MVVGRDPGINIDSLRATVVMALGPTTPAAGWIGRNTDIPVTTGQGSGNISRTMEGCC